MKPTRYLNTMQIIELLDTFILESEKGIRVKKNGSRIRSSSIQKYFYFKNYLYDLLKKQSLT